MPDEKDSALSKILEVLGLVEGNRGTKIPSVEINHFEPHFQVSSPIRITPTAIDQLERTKSQLSGPSPVKPGSVAAVSSSLMSSFHNNEAWAAPLPEHQDAEDNSPGNILGAWDWDIGLGTTSDSSEVQQFCGSASPSGTLVATLEDTPEAFSPVLSGNNGLMEGSSNTDDIEGLIDELSNSVGTLRIGPGGQTHFCGPTSNFNLADMPDSETIDSHRKVQNGVLRCLDYLGTTGEALASLEDHLINLYFTWQDPFFHVVDRRIYEEAKDKWFDTGDTPFYSESLKNSM